MKDILLLPIDLSQDAALELVLPAAIDMANPQNAELHLLTVVPDINVGMFPYVPREHMDEARTQAEKQLNAIADDRLPNHITWHATAMIGPVTHTIIDEAKRLGADLIVMASHDPTVVDLLLGSTADQVVRRAHCSVLVVRDRAHQRTG